MDTPPASTGLSRADRLLLDAINRQLEDPHVATDRLFEMLSELRGIGRRYEGIAGALPGGWCEERDAASLTDRPLQPVGSMNARSSRYSNALDTPLTRIRTGHNTHVRIQPQ